MIREIPLIIDTHVHFRVPGAEYKEDWVTGSKAALHGGVGLVFDMPNNAPSVDSIEKLKAKKKIIDEQIKQSGYPIKYRLYLGATKDNLQEIRDIKNDPELKNIVCGVKLFMGSSTGSLLVDKDEDIKKVFQAAKDADLVVAVHAEDEEIIKANTEKYKSETDPNIHSKVRNNQAAAKAAERAINLTREVGNKLVLCHISTKEEVELIRQAKKDGLAIFAEVCPHHLFLDGSYYTELGNRVKMNPPVRSKEDVSAMWQALNDGTIDILGTDHAPHTKEEKAQAIWRAPSGVPGIETLLPLMLNAVNEEKISFEKLSDIMHNNAVKIFGLERVDGKVLVDMELVKKVEEGELKTKCGWSPFAGRTLKGWPVKIILNEKEYSC